MIRFADRQSVMGKTEVGYLIGACCCGLLGLVLAVVSCATTSWVTAEIKPRGSTTSKEVSQANHGLFTGYLQRANLGSIQDYDIYVTCLMDENVCAWSCLDSDEARTAEVTMLLKTGSALFSCAPIKNSRQLTQTEKASKASPIDKDEFMPAGLWVATLFFTFATILFNTCALLSNIYNIFYNPVELYASPIVIVITYGVSACSTLLTLILWGALFGAYTANNVAVLDTLTKVLTSEASLGWSYFILIPVELAELAAAGLVYYRQIKINRIDEDKVIKSDHGNNDANTFMY